ncbi:MAG: stage III sporulation AC/AD family protein [Candidatus Faecousia sp.]|nr:stage III sporulation AC/AD family protein [Candidatus Faecousia sp.]
MGKEEKDIAAVLSVTVCCIAAAVAIAYLEPVLDLLWELQSECCLPEGLLPVLMKAVGVALVAELSATVCSDAGNTALGKILQILGCAAVLSLSVPIFRTLMTMIREMIGAI